MPKNGVLWRVFQGITPFLIFATRHNSRDSDHHFWELFLMVFRQELPDSVGKELKTNDRAIGKIH